MSFIKITSVPEIEFAHQFGIENYNNTIPAIYGRIEMTYVKTGKLLISQDGHSFDVFENDVFINLFHSPLHVSGPGFHEHSTVSFSVDFEQLPHDSSGCICLSSVIRAESGTNRLRSLIDALIEEYALCPGRKLLLQGLILIFLDRADSLFRQTENFSGRSSIYISRAKKFIYENLSRPIQQKEVAAHLNITPEYLCSLFRQYEGTSVITYINKIKLDKIKSIMEKEHLKLNETAFMFGYSDPNYVSRLYKKIYLRNITGP